MIEDGVSSGVQALLPTERQARVVELVREHGTVRINDLADDLAVSTITVRRDIAQLAAKGLVKRVYGGATAVDHPPVGEREPVVVPATADVRRGFTVGMVVPSLNYYWPGVIRGVREAADEAGVRIVLRGATYEAVDERKQLATLIDSVGVDGLLVAPTTTGTGGEELVRWLRSTNLPVVLVERAATDPYRGAMESVVSDHALGAGLAVRHLAERGHRRIGIRANADSPTSRHVHRGWLAACTDLGLPVEGTPDVRAADRRDPGWAATLDGLLDDCLRTGTTALLVHSDPEAISLVERCRERGIKVPGDLAVVSYDDEVAELCDPPLTAVRPPKAAVGIAALNLLVSRLRHPDADRPVHRIVVEPQLIVRSSS
ncbi:substrate-binding domain-containing protein [Saccharothrix variisporea]|uniref:GntR family transcriptional regulator n=1 Tax=Saccharothrix variisporea TaxID=543527 RepID=A0A495XR23_9PSEU|nr:substrate-binding domain-containing protein [Saccharothrix variisporea]RKT74903.1 GntR family transcriptional regulator [Saccharothrix variisporea]